MPQSINEEVYWEGTHLDPIKSQSKSPVSRDHGSASARHTREHAARLSPCSRFAGSHFPLRLHQKETRGTNTLEVVAGSYTFLHPTLPPPPGRARDESRRAPGSPPASQLYRQLAGGEQGPPPPPARSQGPETAPGPPRAFPHITSPPGLGPALGLQPGGAGGRG